MSKRGVFFSLISALPVLSSCAHGDLLVDPCHGLDQCHPYVHEKTAAGRHLSEAEAVSIAKAEGRRRKQNPDAYKEPDTSYKNGVWHVHFGFPREGLAIGDGFDISVDENTQTTFYSPGR